MGDNPFEDGGTRDVTIHASSSIQVEETRAMAEVKAQVFMARQFPRNQLAATDRILAECDRLKLAEKAIYSYPRGGQNVSGPSIRLAEALKRGWGNMMSGIVEIERTDAESSMLAYAWDLETNNMSRREFKVPHSRDTKQGRKTLTDDRDIYEMTANQGARRERACILAIIPGDVVEAAVQRCEKTLVTKVGNLEEVVPRMVEKFASIGITKQMIEKRLGHRIEATQPAEVVQLGSIFNSIRDGMAVAGDFFDNSPAKAPEEVVKTATPKGKQKPGDDFALTGDPNTTETAETLWVKLVALMNEKSLPDVAKKEIAEANANDEKDVAKLTALLEKATASIL
jgi:hypothetical protein